MYLKKITLDNFRNYKHLVVNFSAGLNFFIGDNAAGKSNLLEAIYFLSQGRSGRSLNESEVIKWGQNEVLILGEVMNFSGQHIIGISLTQSREKKMQLDHKNIYRASDLVKIAPAVFLSNNDGKLISGEPIQRRIYLNQLLIQTETEYSYRLQRLKKILLARNEILRQIREKKQDLRTLEVWNQSLMEESIYISDRRKKIVTCIEETANLLVKVLTKQQELTLVLEYKTNCPAELSGWEKIWPEIIAEEIRQAKTLIGPQRDDLLIYMVKEGEKIPLRIFGSQGQQTVVAYILKLSQAEIIKTEQKQEPLVIADDIFAEVDMITQAQLMEYLKLKEQVFMTTTSPEIISRMGIVKSVYKVSNNECLLKQ